MQEQLSCRFFQGRNAISSSDIQRQLSSHQVCQLSAN